MIERNEKISGEELVRRYENLRHNLDEFFKWMQRPEAKESGFEITRQQLMSAWEEMDWIPRIQEYVNEAALIVSKVNEA